MGVMHYPRSSLGSLIEKKKDKQVDVRVILERSGGKEILTAVAPYS